MKKLFLFLAICSLFLIVSCGGSSNKDENKDNADTGETVNDEDSADSEPTGDTKPGDDTTPDTGDSQDSGDSTDSADSTDDADSSDSQDDSDTSDSGDTDTTPADPCAGNPCKGKENSTEVCSADGENYTCGCDKGYVWKDGSCVLPECSNESTFPCIDPVTGLMWSSKTTVTTAEDMSTKIISHCEDLDEFGFTDWHTPTISQLRTLIINCEDTQPGGLCGVTDSCTQDSCAQSNCTTCDSSKEHSKLGDDTILASSSQDEYDVNYSVQFASGGIIFLTGAPYSIRCARCEDGKIWNGKKCFYPECSKGGDTPCFDSASGLIWSAKEEEPSKTWAEAKVHCKKYSIGGLSGWRLPTIDELKTLLVWSRDSSCKVSETDNCLASDCWTCSSCTETAIQSSSDTNCVYSGDFNDEGIYSKFGDTDMFWSSSLRSNSNSEYAWCVDFGYGHVKDYYVKVIDASGYVHKGNVRCVK